MEIQLKNKMLEKGIKIQNITFETTLVAFPKSMIAGATIIVVHHILKEIKRVKIS